LGNLPFQPRECRSIVESAEIAVDLLAFDRINIPARMRYLILIRPVLPCPGIAPEMFGDEFLLAIRLHRVGARLRVDCQSVLSALKFPVIPCLQKSVALVIGMPHGQGHISFVKQGIRYHGDDRQRYDLADKDHSPLPLAVLPVPDIKTQINFGETSMKGNPKPANPDLPELEAYQADIGIPGIQFGSRRQERTERCRIDGIIGQDELLSLCSEEYEGHAMSNS
jgi:hypothetical protein